MNENFIRMRYSSTKLTNTTVADSHYYYYYYYSFSVCLFRAYAVQHVTQVTKPIDTLQTATIIQHHLLFIHTSFCATFPYTLGTSIARVFLQLPLHPNFYLGLDKALRVYF